MDSLEELDPPTSNGPNTSVQDHDSISTIPTELIQEDIQTSSDDIEPRDEVPSELLPIRGKDDDVQFVFSLPRRRKKRRRRYSVVLLAEI